MTPTTLLAIFVEAHKASFGVVPIDICTLMSQHGYPIASSTYSRPANAAIDALLLADLTEARPRNPDTSIKVCCDKQTEDTS